MTNRVAPFVRSIKCLLSTVMVMMSSMNTYIDASVDVIYTAKWSAVSRLIYGCCFSSCGSKDWCGEFISSVYQDLSRSRSFPRYIASSIIAVYSTGTGVVPKVNLRQRKSSSSTIAMHVAAVIAFACIQW